MRLYDAPVMKIIALALLLAAVGCKGTSESAASCDSAGDGVKALWAQKAAAATSDADKARAARMADVTAKRLVSHCKDDAWSSAAIGCLKAATTQDAMDACRNQLTAAQQDRLKADLENLLAPHKMDEVRH
jgi:small lipoprotein (TIGR04454 family)